MQSLARPFVPCSSSSARSLTSFSSRSCSPSPLPPRPPIFSPSNWSSPSVPIQNFISPFNLFVSSFLLGRFFLLLHESNPSCLYLFIASSRSLLFSPSLLLRFLFFLPLPGSPSKHLSSFPPSLPSVPHHSNLHQLPTSLFFPLLFLSFFSTSPSYQEAAPSFPLATYCFHRLIVRRRWTKGVSGDDIKGILRGSRRVGSHYQLSLFAAEI